MVPPCRWRWWPARRAPGGRCVRCRRAVCGVRERWVAQPVSCAQGADFGVSFGVTNTTRRGARGHKGSGQGSEGDGVGWGGLEGCNGGRGGAGTERVGRRPTRRAGRVCIPCSCCVASVFLFLMVRPCTTQGWGQRARVAAAARKEGAGCWPLARQPRALALCAWLEATVQPKPSQAKPCKSQARGWAMMGSKR